MQPQARLFDPEGARNLVSKLLEELNRPSQKCDYQGHEDQVDHLLVQEFGVWISGWRSAVNGGAVAPYRRFDIRSPRRSTTQVLTSVEQWQAFLFKLDDVFAEFPIRTVEEFPLQTELAANRLLTMVLKRTGAEDAWYNSCSLVLQWYLESQGASTVKARRTVSQVMSGCFSSWVEASPEQIAEAARKTVKSLTSLPQDKDRDSTAIWLSLRNERVWKHFQTTLCPLRVDGHVRYIEQVENDPLMGKALVLARQWAQTSLPLDLATVKGWQSVVLGLQEPVEIRKVDAFAKGGRERYRVKWLPKFKGCLKEANNNAVDPRWRAAVAYLDLAFFHPFDDGNARAARLVMDAILWRAGLALNLAEPAFVMARAAEDDNGPALLAMQIDALSGTISHSPHQKSDAFVR